jgi:hypothetical protein
MPLQIRPVTRGGHAGPVTMGRITRGPLSWTRPHCGMTPSQAFVWCRIERRVSLPVLSLSDQRLQRRPRAKGGVFAFAPTFISQSKYTHDLLKRFGMKDTKPIKTTMGTNGHLDLNATGKSVDQKVYQSMIGSLLYLWASRLDITLSVCMCVRFQSHPKECHLVAMKRIL